MIVASSMVTWLLRPPSLLLSPLLLPLLGLELEGESGEEEEELEVDEVAKVEDMRKEGLVEEVVVAADDDGEDDDDNDEELVEYIG
jgi:hypothetical protein